MSFKVRHFYEQKQALTDNPKYKNTTQAVQHNTWGSKLLPSMKKKYSQKHWQNQGHDVNRDMLFSITQCNLVESVISD